MNTLTEPVSQENLNPEHVARSESQRRARPVNGAEPSLGPLPSTYATANALCGSHSNSLSRTTRPSRMPSTAIPCPSLPKDEKWQEQLESMIHHARLEAESLAATTPFPPLFLPCLLEEKINQAHDYAFRQRQVWQLSRDIRCLAV